MEDADAQVLQNQGASLVASNRNKKSAAKSRQKNEGDRKRKRGGNKTEESGNKTAKYGIKTGEPKQKKLRVSVEKEGVADKGSTWRCSVCEQDNSNTLTTCPNGECVGKKGSGSDGGTQGGSATDAMVEDKEGEQFPRSLHEILFKVETNTDQQGELVDMFTREGVTLSLLQTVKNVGELRDMVRGLSGGYAKAILNEVSAAEQPQQGLTDYGLETKKQQISLAFLAQQFNWQELKQKLPEQQFVDSNNVHFLAKQVPLRAGQPSLLHAQLPCDNPTNKRMKAVKTAIDANRFVLSCAVSGAGKTRLAFDLAKQHKALYFDLNGGLGKEPQRDVSVFRENIDLLIAQIADAHLSDCHKAVLREKGCASLTQALVLSRWISLVLATQSESPQDWLNHQLHEDIFYCSAEIYSSCKEWDQQTRDSVWKELRSMGTTPLLILDEAQYLAKHHKELFKDSQGNANCRPIGACIIRELLNMQLTGFMAGTSMGLGDFEQIISNLGGDTTEGSLMWYSYDFLRDVSDEKIEDSLCIVPISGLFSHFVQTDLLQQTTLECIYRELQGRPRFMASYIQALIKRYGSWIPPDLDVYFLEVLFDHLKRTTFAREGNASLWVAWQKLYDLCDSNPRLWNAALGLLTRGLLHHGEPLLFHEKLEANDLECVSHGISMLAKAIDTQAHQFLAEPMVINAGLDFALTKGIDLAKEYLLEVLHSEPTRAGKALEFLVAIRIFQNKGKELGEMWPHLAEHESKEVKNLAKLKIPEFKGILVGASLLDKRLNMSNREQAEYIVLPHNHAGPDVVAWLLWVSCKFSHAVQISAKERKKSARTSNPNAAYRNKNGVPRDGKWREHHDAFACIVESWKQPCLRMRLELATGQEPEKVADNQQLAEPAKEDLRRSPRTKAKDNVYSTEPADDNERLGSSMVPSEIEVISSYQFLCPNQERSHDIQFYIDSATVEKYFRLN